MYIISLVVVVIIVSEYSPRFAGLIGRKDPISTLATLILLSYAKLLSLQKKNGNTMLNNCEITL